MDALQALTTRISRPVLIGGAAMVVAIVAFALVVATSGTDPDAARDTSSAGGSMTTSPDLGAGGAIEPQLQSTDAAVAPAADGATAKEAIPRGSVVPIDDVTVDLPPLEPKLIRTGSVRLTVSRAHFDAAWDDLESVAASTGGTIAAASRSGVGAHARVGSITLRVPSARFDAALAAVRDTTHVTVAAVDVGSEDVTEQYVDARSRLRHDRAIEARLLALLAETKTVGEVLSVQGRLDGVQERIEVETGRLRYLAAMTSTSTLTVSLRAPASERGEQSDDRPSLRAAFGDAADRFVTTIAHAITWIGGALPILLVLALLVAGGATLARKRR